MEATRQATMKQVREHLIQINKHQKEADKLSEKNSWYLHRTAEKEYLSILKKMYHLSELASYYQNLALTIVHNHESVDFNKLKKSKTLLY